MMKVRIFHLILAVFLAYGSVSYLYRKPVPEWWYMVVAGLAVMAFGYHGYQLIQKR